MTDDKDAMRQRSRCAKCGREMEVDPMDNSWVCPDPGSHNIPFTAPARFNRTQAEYQALLQQLQTVEAERDGAQRHADNFKADMEHVQLNFQRETLRTSELFQMLMKFMKRGADKGCTTEPWAKDDCADCTLMREAKELMERPVNVPKEPIQ